MSNFISVSPAFSTVVRSRGMAFLFVFFLVMTLTQIVFLALSLTPTAVVETPIADEPLPTATEMVVEFPEPVEEPELPQNVDPLPLTLTIDKLDREVTVLNPESRAISDLDAALLEGVVRHPDSATFATEGTMFILGHSSYLPVVNNKNFKAFNGIQNLVWGDTIRVRSSDMEYVYEVERVYKARATDTEVKITAAGARLTLATCNSFGTSDDRYIVEAVLRTSTPIS